MKRSRLPAIGLRIVIIAGLVVFAAYLGLWIALIVNDGSKSADYTAFMTGWTIVLDGRGHDLYDVPTQIEVQRRLLGGLSFEAGLNPFNNPPHLVLPFLPLALLPLLPSYLVWGVIQLALLAWLAWRLLTRVATDWRPAERVLMIVALLAMPSLVITFFQGALSLLVTVAMLESFIALRAGRDRAAAVWLVVASLKPQVAVAIGAAVLGGRRWRVVGWGLGLMAVLALLATVVMGVGIWPAYARFLGDYVGSFDVLSVRPSVMWNLRGTIAMLVGPDSARVDADAINTIALALWLAGLIGIAIWWARHDWDPGSPRFQLGFALTLILGMLLSPHLNPHDGLLLVPAGALAYGAIRTERYGTAFGALLVAAPFLVLLTNPISANDVYGTPVRVPVVIMLIVAGWIGIALGAEPTADLDDCSRMIDPGGDRARRDLRPLWVGLTIIILVLAAYETVLLYQVINGQKAIGTDQDYYQFVARRWLDEGVFYTERQLSGPYQTQTLVDNLYPPHALYLFIPFLVLPDILWWVIPLGVIGYVVWWCRPVVWMWPILALIVLFPKTPGQILFGNTDMWVTAAIAGGVRWAWPSVLVTFKPSLAFFALIGIRSRSWWIAAAVLAVASLPFLPLWLDYPTVMRNSTATVWYSFGNLPFFVLPIVAYLGSSRRGETPLLTWTGWLLRGGGWAARQETAR